MLAIIGVALFMRGDAGTASLKFTWYGFAMLGFAVGAFQLMLDRGQELGLVQLARDHRRGGDGGAVFYLFVVHMFTADRPFLSPALFKDRNFFAAIIMVSCVSSVMLATTALLAPYLQEPGRLSGLDCGLAMAPRGLGIIDVDVRRELGWRCGSTSARSWLRGCWPGLVDAGHEHLDPGRDPDRDDVRC